MAIDPGLAFSSNLVNRFMQMKGLQMQMEFQRRREQRYERQLQEQSRQFGITQAGIAGRHADTLQYRERTAERMEDMAESLKEYRTAQIDVMQDRKPFTEGRIEQTLGELESGGATTMLGHVIPFRDKEGYINHALRRLGPGWLELAPEAAGIINRQFPDEEPLVVPKAFDSAIAPPEPAPASAFRNFDWKQDFLPVDQEAGIFGRLDKVELDRVEVRDKEGRRFTIPREQLDEALAQGYEIIEE